ncbi:MAG: HlyD family efflux transporter periplasmic adaptor subunit, partial [Alphaproteobacteria bacterium]
MASEQRSFDARRDEYESGLQVLRDQALQRELTVVEMKTQHSTASRDFRLARVEFEMSSDLLAESLTPKIDHLRLQREVEELEGKLATQEAGIPRGEAALAEARQLLDEERLKFRRIALEELSWVERQIAQSNETLTKAADQVLRAEICSPIDGVIKSVRYHTIGGVVSPGEAILEIVPTEDNLVIEAKLN